MKINRQQILEKYDSRCAYCGKLITLKTMQVDHIVPKARFHFIKDKSKCDHISNCNPSCRSCNHYKRAESLENFRTWTLGKLHERLAKLYTVKVAIDYNIVQIKPWDKLFYFEKFNEGK